MKTLFKLLLSLNLISFLSACQNNDNVADKSSIDQQGQKKKEVRFIGQWLNEGKREQLVREFVRKYEFEHQMLK
jgi:hypothetical protein